MSYPIISADSHVTEPPNAYIDNIDPAYRDRAPHLQPVRIKRRRVKRSLRHVEQMTAR